MSWFKSKEKFNEEDLKVKEVVELMLNSEETLIEVNPRTVGLEYIISNERNQYYLIIDSVGVKISNHTFSRDMRMVPKNLDVLKELVRKEATKRMNAKKEVIYQNGVDLLNKIILNLK